MSKTYYTLAVRFDDGRWSPEFGSYDLEDVRAERDEYLDNGHSKKSLKIVKTGDNQMDIEAAFAKMGSNIVRRSAEELVH